MRDPIYIVVEYGAIRDGMTKFDTLKEASNYAREADPHNFRWALYEARPIASELNELDQPNDP